MGNQHEILHAPHQELEAIQLEGLKKTVVNVYEKIPFYKESFDAAGFFICKRGDGNGTAGTIQDCVI